MSIYDTKEWDKLLDFAAKFPFESVNEYMLSVDYADWMTDLMEDPDAEIFSQEDLVRINQVLLDAFEQAHGRSLSYWIYRNLLYN